MKYVFEWDPSKSRSNRAKHGVDFRLAAAVFRDPLAVSVYDDHHSADEERWLTMRKSPGAVLLVVAHTVSEVDAQHAVIRLFSARRATRNEKRQYEEGR